MVVNQPSNGTQKLTNTLQIKIQSDNLMRTMIFRNLMLCACAIALMVPFSGCRLLNFASQIAGSAAQVALVKLTFGCLPEGTYLDTPEGPVALQALEVGDTVIGFSGRPVRILQKHVYLENHLSSEYIQITWQDGASIRTSGLHRICGIPANTIQTGDTVAGKEVVAIQAFGNIGKSYDFLTEDEGYQINGIPVNSMIAEMQIAAIE